MQRFIINRKNSFLKYPYKVYNIKYILCIMLQDIQNIFDKFLESLVEFVLEDYEVLPNMNLIPL